jgi:Fic family protein
LNKEKIQKHLGFRWMYQVTSKKPPDQQKSIFRAKKVLAGLVHDMAFLEGNPFTFPEVQTLLDGVTVGGHKLSDEAQILNTAEAWKLLFRIVENGGFEISKEVFCKLHQVAAKGEALTLGQFRVGDVGISGTDYKPPKFEELETLFVEGVLAIKCLEDDYERAFAFFLFGALQQFFWDGNKRTSRLMMAGELLKHGLDIASIPSSKKLEFNQKMVRFYDTKDGSEMMEFLEKCVI